VATLRPANRHASTGKGITAYKAWASPNSISNHTPDPRIHPTAKKPEDWVDSETMPDPEDKKPEDWDKPQHILDPESTKPSDWDDEMDGEWEPPQIDNPEHKGEWKPKEIPNPAYKGAWIHPMVVNPEYAPEPFLYRYSDIGAIGLDLWQGDCQDQGDYSVIRNVSRMELNLGSVSRASPSP
jgi:hypothetical protein